MHAGRLDRRPLYAAAVVCLLGMTSAAAAEPSTAAIDDTPNDLPAGAVAKLGQPARFVGVLWAFDPVAHDRSLSRLAYVGLDGDVILEDVSIGDRRTVLDASAGSVFKLRMSQDDRTITALTEEGQGYEVDVRNLADVTALDPERLGPPYPPRILAKSSNGEYEALLGAGCVEVRRSGQKITCLEVDFEPPPAPPGLIVCHGAAPYSAVFSPNSRKLAIWRSPSKLLVYDLPSQKELRLETLGDGITTASFSPDSAQVYLVHSRDGRSVSRWSAEDGTPLPDLLLEHDVWNHTPRPAWLAPNGKLLIAGHRSGLAAWHPETGRMQWRIKSEIGTVRRFRFSADYEKFVTLSDRGALPGRLDVRLAASGAPVPVNQGHQMRVFGLAFSPDGRHLVSTDVVSESIAWDMGARRAVARVAAPWNRRGSYSPVAGNTLWVSTSGVDDVSIQPYDGPGEPRRLIAAAPDLGMMALSSDERDLAILNEQVDRLCLWNVESTAIRWCKQLEKPSSRSINFAELQFSEDDRFIVALSETRSLLRWQRSDGTALDPISLKTVPSSAVAGLSIRSRQLAIHDDPCISWLARDDTGKVLFSSNRERDFRSRFVEIPSLGCSFTPDTRLGVFLGDDGQITIHRAVDGETLAILSGHAGAVETVAISPDGSLLATAGTDHVIYLWDLSRYR